MNFHVRVFSPAVSALISLIISARPLVLFPLRISFSSLTRSPSVWVSPSTATFTVGSAFATRKFKVRFAVLPFFAVNVKVTSLPFVYTFVGIAGKLAAVQLHASPAWMNQLQPSRKRRLRHRHFSRNPAGRSRPCPDRKRT